MTLLANSKLKFKLNQRKIHFWPNKIAKVMNYAYRIDLKLSINKLRK